MPTDPDQIERAIDRAVAAVKELMGSELRGIRQELHAINARLDRQDQIEEHVAGLSDRMTSAEAFIHSHEKRIGWRTDKLPGFALSSVAVIVSALALLLH